MRWIEIGNVPPTPYLFQEGPKTDGPFETFLHVRIWSDQHPENGDEGIYFSKVMSERSSF